MKTTCIKTAEYPVYIGDEAFLHLNALLEKENRKGSSLFILVDNNSQHYCLPKLIHSIPKLQKAKLICIKSGEINKNINTCLYLWENLTQSKANRKALLLNVGGGVVSDIGGFVASTYKRGIDFIQIPTTLLAQVDASIGGKTGINFLHFKNQIGTFTLPKGVFIAPDFLETLPRKELLSGFAEVIKHALIADATYWNFIQHLDIKGKIDWTGVIARSLEIKNVFVVADPQEKNIRKALNFGHTIGHALESFSLQQNVKPLLHGEAIAIGIICEAYLSHKLLGLNKKDLVKITSFILSHYVPYPIPDDAFEYLVELMYHDKKNEKNGIQFTLISGSIGNVATHMIEAKHIKEALHYYCEAVKNIN